MSKFEKLPDGRQNPQLGLRLGKRPAKVQPDKDNTIYDAGLIVNVVDNNMPGSIAGIIVGDLLTTINGIIVNSVADVSNTLSIKRPGEQIKVTIIRGKQIIEKTVILKSDYDMPKPKNVKALAGGNIYPSVIYDGFIIFNTESMLNNFRKGSTIKLIIPLIGTRFDAADLPVRSYDYEFTFNLD
jgi:membrane-associated protease RseP (regulator of RpoE activity)